MTHTHLHSAIKICPMPHSFALGSADHTAFLWEHERLDEGTREEEEERRGWRLKRGREEEDSSRRGEEKGDKTREGGGKG